VLTRCPFSSPSPILCFYFPCHPIHPPHLSTHSIILHCILLLGCCSWEPLQVPTPTGQWGSPFKLDD
jgi:hypothetical protein